MPKKSDGVRRAPPTLRSTSGAGFDFEDQISAWLLVKMLTGEQAPAIGGAGTQLQAQVSSLGWHIDDLLLTTTKDGVVAAGRLAISAKGNLQVSASGLPADFVNRAWEQWRSQQSPMSRSSDGLALVTRGIHRVFDPNWSEVKNACTGSDAALAMSRIRGNPKQSKIFDSVQNPDENGPEASDEETIELIRRLHVLPLDFQLAHSEAQSQAITQCRQLLANHDATEAANLWDRLINVATEVRLRCGTITIQELWSTLRKEFDLCHHPNFSRDWETLTNITTDYKARIATGLASGYSVPRTEAKSKLEAAISANAVTVVFGDSGSGKSALVKSILDAKFATWTQVWFGPDELKTALSASRRATLPLRHELARILNATTNANNVLIVDSAERIDPMEFVVIRQLLLTVLRATGAGDESAWRVVIITQPQSGVESAESMLVGHPAEFVEVELLKSFDVKLALWASPSLSWLTGHDDTVSALTNLRTLAWVVAAGPALGLNASGLASHTAIADGLWNYWTGNRPDVQALVMRLAEREASFERSFALTELNPVDSVIFTQCSAELPLHLNKRTNRIEFEHDLAADWARFQFLKQNSTDTARWAALAGSPLWANALRMLGQFLLRQPAAEGTAWDAAFKAAQATEICLAGDILLDALCLDPEAERFLNERVELLLANNAKHLNRLLIRFHHIGTVPVSGEVGTASPLGLYIEATLRSVVLGRWPPVLRFLIAQREKLRSLVSSAVAKVIHTWLTRTPQEFQSGAPMPFRRELTEIALLMARSMQVEKAHGVIYLDTDPMLYTAPLAGAADLPDEVAAWALELVGRRRVADEITLRIAEARRQQAERHAKRLQSDPKYRARHEARRPIPSFIGSSRESLPPWPLGACRKVDMDFRTACLKENGLQPLMRVRPDVAAEVLLALIIEDQPERAYGSSRHEIELGLEYAKDGYPTAFWKSPFFSFLQIAPDAGLKALITLVNFCTERWLAEVMERWAEHSPGLTLQLADGTAKTFGGDKSVFDWTQSNSNHNGNLFCALDALERWLAFQLDTGMDITPHIEQILREGASAAFIGLLVNIGKYQPSLCTQVLSPLLTDPHVFFWDSGRVKQIGYKFIAWSWAQAGETVFELARSWTLAPHRQKEFLDVVIDLLITGSAVAARLQELNSNWSLPANQKEALEFKLLFARLDRDNYRRAPDPETGAEVLTFACPDSLSLEVNLWQDKNAKPLQHLLLPERCEKLLLADQLVDDADAAYLYSVLKECEGDASSEARVRARCKLAIAATLIVLSNSWLVKAPEANEHATAIIRSVIAGIGSTTEDIRGSRIGHFHDDLKFAAYAVMHRWMKSDDDQSPEWEAATLLLLTSGNYSAAGTIVSIAYAHRERLGSAWWRLLQAGVLWSGLVLLLPHGGDSEDAERAWGLWLARLRRFPLRGRSATADDLRMTRIAAGCERLEFAQRMRAYKSGQHLWRGKPERRVGRGLDGTFLAVLFHWLIQGTGVGDWNVDTRLVGRLWAYDVERAKQRAKEDNGEYDLPSQSFGYDLLQKLAELSLAAPEAEARTLWEPVLVHGPAAHYALQHFIRSLFLSLSTADDSDAFERVWRATAEYGLAANWGEGRLWYYGEQLLCDLLGFGNEEPLRRLAPGAVLRMRDLYEHWAELHVRHDEKSIERFCNFLTTEFGAPLRLDGLRWIAATLKSRDSSSRWHRPGTSSALIELLNTSLSQDAHAFVKDHQARQALVEIAALLAAESVPTALVLQERIKLLR